jgi:hypothetical protein
MREYHLHPDGHFIIRENGTNIAILNQAEIFSFAIISIPEGCTEILIGTDGIVYATVKKAQEGLSYNPLLPLIEKQEEIITYYNNKPTE